MKKTIIVLGMHRSGTSAMTGVLNKLGCYSGQDDDLFSPDSSNSFGYFERKDVVSCNEGILSNYFFDEFKSHIVSNCFEDKYRLDGYGWMFSAWSPSRINRASQEAPQCIYDSIKKLQSTVSDDSLAYVIKDPRISITFPLWAGTFNEKPLVIIMLRNPMHVADSLFKRDGIPIAIGLDIWASYTISSFENTEEHPRLIVSYDDLVDKTEDVINGACSFLKRNGIDAKKKSSAIEFINYEMRHSNRRQLPSTDAGAHIIQLYERIRLNDLEAVSELKHPWEKDNLGWEKLLFIPSLSHKKKMQEIMNANITRLLNHPITGPVIKAVRWLKKDYTFGSDFVDKNINYYSQLRPEMLHLIPTEATKILDVGCAHGVFLESIKSRQAAETWGVEINEEASKEASKRLDYVINKNVESALGDLPESYFDCIIFNDILEHMVDPYTLVNKIQSKLASEGVVVASLPNVRFFEVLFFLLFFKRWDYQKCGVLDRTHLRFFTYKNMQELFTMSGYEILSLKGVNPTKSILFNVVNILTLGFMWDSRYTQFACVVKKKKVSGE